MRPIRDYQRLLGLFRPCWEDSAPLPSARMARMMDSTGSATAGASGRPFKKGYSDSALGWKPSARLWESS